MVKIIIVFFIFYLLSGCQNTVKVKGKLNAVKKTAQVEKQQNEDFTFFIKEFMKDSTFQKDRIVFPHIIKTYNLDTDSFDIQILSKEEWKFKDLLNLPSNYFVTVKKRNVNEYIYDFQIDDTGVSINYVFRIRDDKWYLVEIIDDST
uniref:DUF4348 domain-containing protein n=1 Tax=Prevotella sp. GTC17260 TaxID=3236796 RepID=A0AB33JEM6_9BACT